MDSVTHILNRDWGTKKKNNGRAFYSNITACMKMTSFRGVVKNNLTLKTKSQYIIDRFEIEKRLREPF